MGTESCPCMQLPALVCKPWSVTSLFDPGISERFPEGLEHYRFQIVFIVYIQHAHLHIVAYGGHMRYNTGKDGAACDSPREPAAPEGGREELWKFCLEQCS